MPSRSVAQRRLFALAEHRPEELYSANKSLAKLPHRVLHEFAATKETGLPKRVEKKPKRKWYEVLKGQR